ncbi:DEAD/DEAH box helicase family protein [Enterococcus hulanensis]|uniref:DEAD/DEAH box helicase family protein n=1 Tax=Enterococcus hulanensis TaxID=2559929 RepID=UPI0010F5D22B|nr:DEAD/DEAH box helicase family protein [Enterococcus hulanensis]
MAFNTRNKDNKNFNTPQEMFKDNKKRKIEGPLAYQSKMIDIYMQTAFKSKDVAIELPTGSGKTIIGLLIGEFRRRKYNEKVVYVCPNNQLVNQVAETAEEKYGISVTTFTGSKKEYNPQDKSEYLRSTSMAVTNYSSIFNANSYFQNADVLIFDDTHSADGYIANNWTLNINRYIDKDLFYQLLATMKSIISESDYDRMWSENLTEEDKNWCDLVPALQLKEIESSIKTQIDNYVEDTDMYYSWSKIRNNLLACNVYLSKNDIYIRPVVPPTQSLDTFSNPKQRIYMSATLGNSGELERSMGVSKIKRLNLKKEDSITTIGRRYFVFPGASFNEESKFEIMAKLSMTQPRSLILTESDEQVRNISEKLIEQAVQNIYQKEDLKNSFSEFENVENGVAVLANRFDGIDLGGDKCRMLMLYNLPTTVNYQEKFFKSKLATGILYTERIKTRITQAVGRCTRSDTDYSVVVVLGDDLENALLSSKMTQGFTPELTAEINVGFEMISQNQSSIQDLIDNVNLIYQQGEDWSDLESEIISERDEILLSDVSDEWKTTEKYMESLRKSATHEVNFQYHLWNGKYEEALQEIDRILPLLDGGELKGYKAYWIYMSGVVNMLIYQVNNVEVYIKKANSLFEQAATLSSTIRWFRNQKKYLTSSTTELENRDLSTIAASNIESQLVATKLFKQNEEFETQVSQVFCDLSSSDGKVFEKGLVNLGKLIGYMSINSENSGDPDPRWMLENKLCIVTECKIFESIDQEISINNVRQAASHINWIEANQPGVSSDTKVISLFISNSSSIDEKARIHATDLFYCNRENIIQFAHKAIGTVRNIRRNFVEEGSIKWREFSVKLFETDESGPEEFLSLICSKELKDL